MIEKCTFPLKVGELVKLIPGQYLRRDHRSALYQPYVTLDAETNAVLVEYQGETNETGCWTVLASDEILVAWENNLSRI